ncbi:MAG: HAMP domain-containing sensor histidine kinase [Bacteroidales bacterium]|nr:HAMP domain-containing sensor histidine kinase [Bacteroidales bacterium]
MNKKLLYILILCICISLVGIIIVQFFWIRNAFQVKEAQFNRSVNDALGDVVNKIETRENMHFISRNYEGDSIMSIVQAFSKDSSITIKARLDSLLALNELPETHSLPKHRSERAFRRPLAPGVLHYSYQYNVIPVLEGLDSLTIRMEQVYEEMHQIEPDAYSFEWKDQVSKLDSMIEINERNRGLAFQEKEWESDQAGNKTIILTTPGYRRSRNIQHPISPNPSPPTPMSRMKVNREKFQYRENNIQKLDNKAKKIQDVIKKMAIELETKPAPIQQRINKKTLQASLSKSLIDKGIDLPFEFAVYSPTNDSNHIPIRSAGFIEPGTISDHKVSLFPNDLFKKPDLLVIRFPGQKTHVLKSLSLLLAGSVLFTLIIILSSGASIVVMIRQKKISDIKTDFINNMTHEFKTPIATISIAADSINNPRVLSEPDTIKNFTRIIKEENNRMNTRVEQVLQMALLDSRDFKLRLVLVDLNELIERVTDHFRLQVEKREGKIITDLRAENPMVLADEDHMRNVLLNLLDNANKYSIIKPQITVTSFNRSGKYFFSVQDRGLGMSADTQRKIFDKFYRVTSGNIHNIKGFGLGLSYVRAIVLAHKGEIQLQSEFGKGSKFEISMVNAQTNQNE